MGIHTKIRNRKNHKLKAMKNFTITLIVCLFTFTANAQNIITIDNSPQSTTTHQTLQAALDAATVGDIIHVQPTATSYGDVVIDKAITIIGRSHSESNRESKAGNITVGSSSVIIKGISLGTLTTNANGTIPHTGLRLYECKAGNVILGLGNSPTITISDVEVQGCTFFTFIQRINAQNILLGNNILTGGIVVNAPETVVISNNIFRGGSGDITLQNASTTETAILFNNMFTTNSGTDKTVTIFSGDFNFSNCLTYNFGAGNLIFTTANGGTFLENDSLFDTDPLFVDIDGSVATSFAGSSPTYNPVIRMDDLTLQAASPALTGGGGGSQIGLFNNGFNYDYIGNPRDVPTLDIINYDAAVPKNGTINVTITAKAH